MMLDPISDAGQTLADQAYDAIVLAVLTRGIELGSPLIMDQLAASLNISRTPVRDALQRLEHEGLVEQRGRRGFVVRSISDDDVRQLYQAREAIEGYAARWVAVNAEDEFFERLETIVQNAQDALDGSVLQSYRSNRIIHRTIVEAVGNSYLTANFDSLWGASIAAVAYGHLFLREVEMQNQDIVGDHKDLIASLRSGDARKAGETMEAHVQDGLASNLR